jgi:hypothetical protein
MNLFKISFHDKLIKKMIFRDPHTKDFSLNKNVQAHRTWNTFFFLSFRWRKADNMIIAHLRTIIIGH